ncbi:heme exporter protein CcmD [Pasteurella sp. PK-2025]|uniref:heme exporter protein CcmD n=1 Tax=Pasteurella sp. PK-2025 TaxID=3413133 RepID=UPI003C74EBAB
MFFDSWGDFFHMGGYGFYVWLSYLISLVCIVVLIVQSVGARKKIFKQVLREQQREERLQKANARGML